MLRANPYALCISVKLKNLKANHNEVKKEKDDGAVMYIRKVKKSESKSQQYGPRKAPDTVMYIRKVKKSESKSQHSRRLPPSVKRYVYP